MSGVCIITTIILHFTNITFGNMSTEEFDPVYADCCVRHQQAKNHWEKMIVLLEFSEKLSITPELAALLLYYRDVEEAYAVYQKSIEATQRFLKKVLTTEFIE